MPKRRFFQLHLSTALLLMFVASLMLWANIRESWQFLGGFGGHSIHSYGTGWPFQMRKITCTFVNNNKAWSSEWQIQMLVYDLIINISFLLIVFMLCELRIQRKAAAQNDQRQRSQL